MHGMALSRALIADTGPRYVPFWQFMRVYNEYITACRHFTDEGGEKCSFEHGLENCDQKHKKYREMVRVYGRLHPADQIYAKELLHALRVDACSVNTQLHL